MTIIFGKENHLLITQPKNQNKKAPCAAPKSKMTWQVGSGEIRGGSLHCVILFERNLYSFLVFSASITVTAVMYMHNSALVE